MNQNGDPSQAWIKLKPDGRVDVFSGTVDIGQGSKTVHTQIVADTLGVPYDWVTMDNTNTDSSAVCTGTFASRGTFIGGNAVRLAAERVRERILDIASKELEIDAGRPRDRRRRGDREGRAAEEDQRRRRRRRGDLQLRRADQRLVDGAQAVRRRRRRRPARSRSSRTRRSRTPRASPTSRSTTRPARSSSQKMVQVYDVGRAINPTLVEGQIEGGAMMGLGLGLLESSYPYYPSVEHRGGAVRRVPRRRRCEDLPELDNVILENPSERRAVRREGDRRDGQQRAAAGDRERDLRRRRRVGDRDAGDAGARAARRSQAKREPRRDGKRVIFDEDISVKTRLVERRRRRSSVSMPEHRARGPSAPGTAATRGSSSTACACTRSAASRCCSAASRTSPASRCRGTRTSDTEQVMFILEGEVEMTIEDETTTLGAGDVVVVNRGLHHKLYSENGVTFIEALAPVPLDHVPDKELDLVLGPDGGAHARGAVVDAARPRRAVRAPADAGARVAADRPR